MTHDTSHDQRRLLGFFDEGGVLLSDIIESGALVALVLSALWHCFG
jgi:hypothetical protein